LPAWKALFPLLGLLLIGGWILGVAGFARADFAVRNAEALHREVAALRSAPWPRR